MMADDTVLEVRDLQVSFRVYGGKTQVLDGVNLRVAKGQRVGLVGEAGCGKTTTLKTIMGILPSQAVIEGGQVLFRGRDMLKAGPAAVQSFRRSGAAMIFQDPTAALNPVFTVGDLLGVGLRYATESRGKTDKAAIDKRCKEALAEVSLPDPDRIMKTYPFQLSGGMRQRVCIASAMTAAREVLLADEPGTSLDVTIQDQILRLITGLSETKGLAVVLVTHSLGVVREVTEYVYVMYAGVVVEGGPTADVFSRPLHPYTAALMECVPRLTGRGFAEGIPGRLPDYRNPPRGCRFSPRCPQSIKICEEVKPPLGDTGGRHTVACHLKAR
jgi:peptide/nickel transport system ATP-binding protein